MVLSVPLESLSKARPRPPKSPTFSSNSWVTSTRPDQVFVPDEVAEDDSFKLVARVITTDVKSVGFHVRLPLMPMASLVANAGSS